MIMHILYGEKGKSYSTERGKEALVYKATNDKWACLTVFPLPIRAKYFNKMTLAQAEAREYIKDK